MDNKQFQDLAAKVRIDVIRAIFNAGSGHPGGSLSAADIVTALYFKEMNIDPADPGKADRDKFILSKGHEANKRISEDGRHYSSTGFWAKSGLC